MTTKDQQAIKAAINGNWNEAIRLNIELIDSGDQSVAVYNRLGKAYSEVSDWPNAIKSFEQAIKIDPVNSVAEKGLYNAKLNKRAGVSTSSTKDTVMKDMNNSKIIEVSSSKLELNEEYTLEYAKSSFYFLIDTSGKKLRRISRKSLGLKRSAKPKKLEARVVEVQDNIAKIKLIAKSPVFSSEKAQTDPSLDIKRSSIEAEKKQIAQMYHDEVEIEE